MRAYRPYWMKKLATLMPKKGSTASSLFRMARALGTIALVKVDEILPVNSPSLRRPTLEEAKQQAERQKNLNDLVNRCIIFTNCNGKVLSQEGAPVTSRIVMEHKEQDLVIKFGRSDRGNGGCWVKVTHKDWVVLEAVGNFMAEAYNVTATTYVHGDWEREIPTNFAP